MESDTPPPRPPDPSTPGAPPSADSDLRAILAPLDALEEAERRQRAAMAERLRPRPLTPAQLARVDRHRELPILQDVRDRRFGCGPACPRCQATRVVRWGRFSGRQRYRCRACTRTFSDLTGTPLAYTKRLRLWPAYCECMLEGRSVRASARQVGVHKDTAFRWRHRILAARLAEPARPLVGIIELTETIFPYSLKGQRAAHGRHGEPMAAGRGRAAHAVRVLLLADRRGGRWSGIVGTRRGPIGFEDVAAQGQWLPRAPLGRGHSIESALYQTVQNDAVLIARRGIVSKYAAVARRLGMQYRQGWDSSSLDPLPARRSQLRSPRREPLSATQHPLHHVGNIRAYARRLREWMPRFRGVATKYLENYLIWYDFVDGTRRAHMVGELLRWEVRAPP